MSHCGKYSVVAVATYRPQTSVRCRYNWPQSARMGCSLFSCLLQVVLQSRHPTIRVCSSTAALGPPVSSITHWEWSRYIMINSWLAWAHASTSCCRERKWGCCTDAHELRFTHFGQPARVYTTSSGLKDWPLMAGPVSPWSWRQFLGDRQLWADITKHNILVIFRWWFWCYLLPAVHNKTSNQTSDKIRDKFSKDTILATTKTI
jgi:hypothetical protein